MKQAVFLLICWLSTAAHALAIAQDSPSTLLLKAERGDPIAQTQLADAYRLGHGIPQDAVMALKWYRLAADQGYEPAQVSLGTMYHLGFGTPKDDSKAASWYEQAAKQADPAAEFMLGQLYRSGSGVKQDFFQAMRLFEEAAKQGHIWALESLGLMYYEGQGVPRDYTKALALLTPTARNGSPNAQYHVGLIYRMNQKDLPLAASWIGKAAEWGLVPAQIQFGAMLSNGEGIRRDYVGAYKWFLIAAARGDAEDRSKSLASQTALRKHLTLRQLAIAKQESAAWLKNHVPVIPEHYN